MANAEGAGVLRKLWRYARWVLFALVVIYVGLVTYSIAYHANEEETAEAVAFIHSQKITMEDVDGKHLPPPPDPKLVDATVAGVDANDNGIRDDVELAIFRKYPNDVKIRAAALQYAMTEQMYLTQVFNSETWKAVAEESGRANSCLSLLGLGFSPTQAITDYVDEQLTDTLAREQVYEQAFVFTTSHGDAKGYACDLKV